MNFKILYRSGWMLLCWICWSGNLSAQQQEQHYDPSRKYEIAQELFIKEKYSAARKLFSEFLSDPGNAPLNDRINAAYYAALSGAELFHPDAENELVAFTKKYPESLKAKIAYFNAARVLYKQKRHKQAVEYFEKTDLRYLTNEEIAEYYFKSGYCYFMTGDYTRASKNFSEILKVDSRYRTSALYYYAHVAYQNNNLNTAYEYFTKLDSSETFSPLVPYYIVQIRYEQKQYDDVIAYAKTIESRPDVRNKAEIDRFVAESYYMKGDFKKALAMFEAFEQNYPHLSREDYYQLGYCNYQSGNFKKAVSYFEKSLNTRDKLQQTAYFNMADCFIRIKDKQSARNALQFASRDTFDIAIREQALFNYAKLSYELNFQPLAINSFNEFNRSFPNSKFTDEVNEILAQLYITTKNYKDALTALDKIRNRSKKANEAYQKVAYYRGIEFFNDGDYDKAIGLFNKAITTTENQMIRAEAMYWKAEAIYNQNQYDAAIKQYRIFIFNPPSVNTAMYNTANYNMGYCYFKKADYAEANTWFRKYVHNKNETTTERYNDACIRTGDGFLVLKEYDNALGFYGQAISGKAKSADYALFQTGIIKGLLGDNEEKVRIMNQLATSYPRSTYLGGALYEKGDALLGAGENEQAETMFKKVIREFPQSEYAKRSMLKAGLAKYNLKRDEDALATYKELVKKYPSTPESVSALNGIKNIYVSSGRPQEYFDYVKNVSSVNISAGAQDSITYEAAEQLYLKGDNANAARSFDEYLKKFPDGYFSLNARFYKAESDYRNKETARALEGYLFVTEAPKSIFTEKSLLRAAGILYATNKKPDALPLYQRLENSADFRDNIIEAQAGQMRCHYDAGSFDNCILFARKLIDGDKIPNDLIREAHLMYARSAMATADYQSAEREFGFVSKVPNSVTGAESKFNLALIQYKLGNYKESQKKCFEVINQVPSYEYWIGKSFLLLGDNYLALGDTFQAKHTYGSLVENYEKATDDPEDLKAMAQEKIIAIDKKENELKLREIEEKEKKYYGGEKDSTDTENQ